MANGVSLVDFITSQRWYGSKTRDVSEASVVDRARLRDNLELQLVEVTFDTGTHETYQLLSDESGLDALADEEQALELLRLMRAGETVAAQDGQVQFAHLAGHAGKGEPREARLIVSEQSNTSVVFDEELILKVFRRLEAGINPELELLHFLTEAGFENIAQLAGWYAYAGLQMDATLGIAQHYIAGAEDGWERALDAIVARDDVFLDTLRRLGEITGAMHTVLGSNTTDSNFCPEQTSAESLGLLTATVDEEIERVFASLPDDEPDLEPIRGRGEEVRERLRLLTNLGGAGRVIRNHGDFHLGQTLWSGGDWILLDFEGEPARSLPERRRKRSPLRDVAGMLRSFAYAASAATVLRGVEAPLDWEERARAEFLDGYRQAIELSLVPSGASMDKLLRVFELEKAVYELRYELNNRPDWVRIPVAGIARMLDEELPG
jgi:trehalose synthase-fused probable maltokinase